MRAELKTVKIPAAAYEAIRAAREQLLRRGIDSLPQDLVDPTTCPLCRGDLDRPTAGSQYLHCPRCNYRQQALAATSDNGVALGIGVLVGLGAAALLSMLSGPAQRSRSMRTVGRPSRGARGRPKRSTVR